MTSTRKRLCPHIGPRLLGWLSSICLTRRRFHPPLLEILHSALILWLSFLTQKMNLLWPENVSSCDNGFSFRRHPEQDDGLFFVRESHSQYLLRVKLSYTKFRYKILNHCFCFLVQILVRTMSGEEFMLAVHSTDSVRSVKANIFESRGHPPSTQRLIFCWKNLEDHRTLEEYGVNEESTQQSPVNLVLRLRDKQ